MSTKRVVLMLVLALGCGLAACGEEKAAGPQPFTEEIARQLLPDAASMDPRVLHQIVELGAKLSARDIQAYPSLTALTLTLQHSSWPPASSREVQLAPKVTPAELVPFLYDGEVPSKPDPSRRPTLLHEGTITSISITQDGDAAEGVVQFECGSLISGPVQYEARRIDGAWAITAFALRKRGTRLERSGDAWRLQVKPVESLPVDLPEIEAGGAEPPDKRITVSVSADGTVWFEGNEFAFSAEDRREADAAVQALRAELGKRVQDGPRDSDKASTLDFVLVPDAAAKWQYAQWVLQMAAAERIYRVHFAVQPRNAKDAAVIRILLPKDRGRTPTSEAAADIARIKVKLFRRNQSDPAMQHTLVKIDSTHQFVLPKGWRSAHSSPSASARTEYLSAMEKIRSVVQTKFEAGGEDVRGEIIAPPPKGGAVPCEDVMNVLAIMRSVGIQDVTLQGQALPLTDRERGSRPNK